MDRLKNIQLQKSKPKEKEYNLSDGAGLSLRIKPNGSKLWLFNYYRPITKKRANISFGSYPDVTLAQAREKRREARALLAEFIDPQDHKSEQLRELKNEYENKLEKVARSWLALKKPKITPDYYDDILRSLEIHIFPMMGRIPINKITAPRTIEILTKAGEKRELIKRLSQRLNQIMQYAVNTGMIDNNPLQGVRHAFESPEVKNNPTLRPEQLPQLMRSINFASIRQTTRCLIEWQLHTMTRPGEAAGTRWDEIDTKKAIWHIPAERMKKRRDHTIPLTKQTLGLLEHMRQFSGNSPFVFPANTSHRKPANASTVNMALKRMGYSGRLTAHGMRSIASTTLNEEGFNPDVIEAALAHVDTNETRRAYNRAEYLEKRRELQAWWSNYIEQAATGNYSLAAGF